MPRSHRLNIKSPMGLYSSKNCEISKDGVSEKKQLLEKRQKERDDIIGNLNTNKSELRSGCCF